MSPVLVDDGECQACSESWGAQSGPVVQLLDVDVDVGQGPRKNAGAHIFGEDEHALQRLDVLGSVGVSRDIRKELKYVVCQCVRII